MLDNNIVQVLFRGGSWQDGLFDPRKCDKSENAHLMLLPDPVGPIFRLSIHLWIEIGVKDDDSVGHLQI